MLPTSFTPSWILFFQEIKWRLFYLLLGTLTTFSIVLLFYQELLVFITSSLLTSHNPLVTFIFTSPTEAFLATLHLAFFLALYFMIPSLLIHFYLFSINAMLLSEKKYFRSLLLFSILLWICAFFSSFLLLIPLTFHFFLHFQIQSTLLSLSMMTKVSEFLHFITPTTWLLTLLMQLPLLFSILLRSGILTSCTLASFRKIYYLVSLLLAAILTPPDIFSQLLVACIFTLLYESLFLFFLYQKNFYEN
uniref:Sec-independent protein translocase component TatC n=1 Tax=Jakoba libera TaxID=143017 RepID=M4QDN3_JAKLI|nr:Sec-independent protein translocase component TatC [Jakoba libera]AGH24250.1 Sec-independent protein translocase component TatC [Jakoba libera]